MPDPPAISRYFCAGHQAKPVFRRADVSGSRRAGHLKCNWTAGTRPVIGGSRLPGDHQIFGKSRRN